MLVDTDLRSNDCLTFLNISNQYNYNLSLDCINIKQLTLERNLFLITSGFENIMTELHTDLESIKQDPSRLLASAKMHLLMEELKAHFDIVIYDLCAVLGFADVSLLAGQTDGIVLVTGVGKIQTMELTEALNRLRLCQAPILGLAINKVVNNS